MKADEFKLVIPEMHYQKVMHFVNKTNFEVSGFAHIDFDPKTKTFTVGEPFLAKQENHATETEIDAMAVNKAQYKLFTQNQQLRWWWHSHVNMGVFWSGTDMATIRQLGGQGWIVASVFNKKAEIKSALLTAVEAFGEKQEIFLDNIPTQITTFIDRDVLAGWDKEFEENVTIKTYKWDGAKNPTSPRTKGMDTGTTTMPIGIQSDFDRTWERGKKGKKNKKGKEKPIIETFRRHSDGDVEINGFIYSSDELREMAMYWNLTVGEYMKLIAKYGDDVDNILEEVKKNEEYQQNMFLMGGTL